ncbi:MAG TPA: tyrosine-type recombinase/integrase, partial [Phycisphaerae bacterium]|nr:tyrosine-type recombinase/integrase [Phycisphaerae bacterium]
MASITRRSYWVDPATGKEVSRGTPGAVRRQAKRWRIRFRAPSGKVISRVGYTDKRATEQLAAKLEAAAARGEELLVDQFADHNKRPLSRHLEDFLRDLELRGRDDAYRYVLDLRLKKLARECRWTRLCDVTAESFHDWRRRQVGKSGKTLNDFLDAVRRMMNWAVESKRAARNPVAGMARLPHEPVFKRLALQADELRLLFAAAPIERYQVYVFAVTTGLRRQEIADLRWGDVKLDVPRPFLALRAEATKARRDDDVALKPEIAQMLRGMRPAGFAEEDAVFAQVPSAQVLRQDLAAAGVELPAGIDERLDFHSLRTTLGSFLGTAHLPERVGMEILRVTDPKLLHRTYCDPRVLRTGDAITAVDIPTEPAR